MGIAKSVTFSLSCCLRVGYWIHWDAICFTQCLDLLSMAENNLKKHRPVYSAAAEAQKGLYLRSYPYRRYNKLILVSF